MSLTELELLRKKERLLRELIEAIIYANSFDDCRYYAAEIEKQLIKLEESLTQS